MLAARGVGAVVVESRVNNSRIRVFIEMNVHIRRAATADAQAIAAVHVRSWQVAYRGQISDAYLDRLDQELPHRTETWHTHISNPPSNTEFWVAGDDSRIDGFVALGPAREAGAEVGEVYAIYVHPGRWNQGVGRELFTHATERLISLGFSAATLWVLESNARARRFYELAGWNVDGRTKLDRPDGIELKEISYRKELRGDKEE